MKTTFVNRACRAGACALALLASAGAAAQDYKVLVPQLSPATTEIYKQLAARVVEAGGAKASIEVVPFSRALHQLETNRADLMVLIIENPDPAKAAELKFDYSTTPLFPLAFVLYANKSKPVNPADLKNGNPQGLVVETDLAHVDHFPFPTVGSTSIDSSLSKLAIGRIDAYVFAQPSTDAALKRLQLTSIHRQFYAFFNARLVLPKGARGGPLDRLLTAGLEKMKRDGSYEQILNTYLEGASKFADWQP